VSTHSKTRRHGPEPLAAADETFFQEYGRTRVPRLVQWFVTLDCPLSCEHCLAVGRGAADDEMRLNEAALLIEQVAAMGVEELLLTGGEPLARPDLPDILGILRSNGVRWSLNTAVMPDAPARAAIERWPPYFVAVSLDGPEEVHDAFRGREGTFADALRSMSYFAGLSEHGVTAGTTVTRRNFSHLDETFGVVLESAATSWGLHLLVPEGRAGRRRDLFLSRNQLRYLIRFAAARRNHFPVTMADEIGYCGSWEPLLRHTPFFCGAGRTHCAVLPNGQVTPCSTLDPAASEGNIRERGLAEIWETGFTRLRDWAPDRQCVRCRYAMACRGGCWLQRRHGTQCFKDVWNVPKPVKAACLAVCIGLAGAGLASPGKAAPAEPDRPVRRERERRDATTTRLPRRRGRLARRDTAQAALLERFIIQWHTLSRESVLGAVRTRLPNDPGAGYFLAHAEGSVPKDLPKRVELIKAALETDQRSLSLIALMWRDVTEWCLDSEGPTKRTLEERQVLRQLLTSLHVSAHAWRQEIFEKKIGPFLARDSRPWRPLMSKAGPRRHERVRIEVVRKRWQVERRAWGRITKEYLEQHPYAELMTLSYETGEDAGLLCVRGGSVQPADGRLQIFDLLTA